MSKLEKDLIEKSKNKSLHINCRAQALKILALLDFQKRLEQANNN